MRVYISGPMTGYPEFNYPEFHRVAEEWRKLGHDVFCPAENFNGSTHLPYEFYMKEDLRLVMHCDAIVLLSGWSKSRGALIETLIALTTGLHVFREDGKELDLDIGGVAVMLGVIFHEHSDQRKDEGRENYPNGHVDSGDGRHGETVLSGTPEGSSSDIGLEGEESGDFARFRPIRLRQGPDTFSGIATGEKWGVEPAGVPGIRR